MMKQKVSIRIGSSSGANHSGFRPKFSPFPRNVCPITETASPKKEPNIKPQKVVAMPHRKNIRIVFFMPVSIVFPYFHRIKPVPRNIRIPYPASDSIMPNRM